MHSGHYLGRLMTSAAAILIGGIASATLIAPSPAAAADLPDLQLSIAVTPARATYAVGDAITTSFTVKNVGGATAVNARITGGHEDGMDRKSDPPSAHHDLKPGESMRIDWAGTINKYAAVGGHAGGPWTVGNDAGEANEADNTARWSIAVPGSTGVLRVKVFVDVKADYDQTQPGLAGATIIIRDEEKTKTVGTVKTGADGYFTTTLPAGTYWLTATGWKLRGDEYAGHVQVMGGQTSNASLPLLAGGNNPVGSTPVPSTTAVAVGGTPGGTGGGGPVLAVTGASAGPTILVGAAVILVGAAALFMARRRRNRFVLPK
jgi:LPXTG-motif cell wall-anchored protein